MCRLDVMNRVLGPTGTDMVRVAFSRIISILMTRKARTSFCSKPRWRLLRKVLLLDLRHSPLPRPFLIEALPTLPVDLMHLCLVCKLPSNPSIPSFLYCSLMVCILLLACLFAKTKTWKLLLIHLNIHFLRVLQHLLAQDCIYLFAAFLCRGENILDY